MIRSTTPILLKISIYLWLILLQGQQTSHAQAYTVIQAPPAERIAKLWLYDSATQNDTTRALAGLDSIITAAKVMDDELLWWSAELLKTEVQKHNRFDKVPQRIEFLKSRQPFFLRSQLPVIIAQYYLMLGSAYFSNFNFTECFNFYFRAKHIFEQVGYENIPQAAKILNRYFFLYYYFEDYRTAIHFSELTEKYNEHELVGPVYLLNNRGEAFMKIREYDKAKELFLRAIQLAEARRKMVFFGIANGNYGNALRLQRRYKEALPYFYTDIAVNKRSVPDNTAITCLYLADCLLRLDSVAKAKTYLDLSQRLAPASSKQNKNDWHWSIYGTKYYEVKALYAEKTGSLSAALQYKDSLIVLTESQRRLFDDKLLLKAQAQLAADGYLRKVEAVEQEKIEAILRRNILIAATVIIALLLLYLLNYRRLREKEIQQLEKKRADDLLSHATGQLAQYVENLKSKNDLIDQLSTKLEPRASHLPESIEVGQHLEELRQQVILTEAGWEQFKHLFEQVYPAFFGKLQSMSAQFSPADIRLLALLKLSIPSREAAHMLGISVDSLRKARYRLRKKVAQLPADMDLGDLVERL